MIYRPEKKHLKNDQELNSPFKICHYYITSNIKTAQDYKMVQKKNYNLQTRLVKIDRLKMYIIVKSQLSINETTKKPQT